MFGKRKKQTVAAEFDRENEKPVIRSSICTGEQVAGFKNIHTGRFREIMLIRGEEDLQDFKQACGGVEITKEY